MNTLSSAIEAIGLSEMAAGLNVSAQRLSNWVIRGVPAEHCISVERYTKEAGHPVMCEQLRPEIDWSYLRGVAAEKAA